MFHVRHNHTIITIKTLTKPPTLNRDEILKIGSPKAPNHDYIMKIEIIKIMELIVKLTVFMSCRRECESRNLGHK
jgi:hypothetical protein